VLFVWHIKGNARCNYDDGWWMITLSFSFPLLSLFFLLNLMLTIKKIKFVILFYDFLGLAGGSVLFVWHIKGNARCNYDDGWWMITLSFPFPLLSLFFLLNLMLTIKKIKFVILFYDFLGLAGGSVLFVWHIKGNARYNYDDGWWMIPLSFSFPLLSLFFLLNLMLTIKKIKFVILFYNFLGLALNVLIFKFDS